MKVEICIDCVASAVAAEEGGADRVELCANLVEGGTTPSAGMVRHVRDSCGLGLMVIIRPRGGDFLFSEDEKVVCLEEVRALRKLGVDGVVIGALCADGRIDSDFTRELLEAAEGLDVTFHRAFDMARDLDEALDDLIELGVGRVLTSGGKVSALEGAEVIKGLVARAAGKISVMPGGGIDVGNVRTLVDATGVGEVHLSARKVVESGMVFRRDEVFMGKASEGAEYVTKVADVEVVREVVRCL